MLSALHRLFQRYCDQHYAIYVPGFPIIGPDGSKLGHLDKLCFGRSTVRAEGWTTAKSLAIGSVGSLNWVNPDIERKDVNAAEGFAKDYKAGFNLVGFGDEQALVLAVRSSDFELRIANLGAGRLRKLKAELHIRLSFSRDILRAFPHLFRAAVRPSLANRQSVKRALRLSFEVNQHTLQPEFFARAKPISSRRGITIVMPVFNAHDVLVDALSRVAMHTDVQWRMLLIEDCSTDLRIRPMLRDWARQQCCEGNDVQIIENDENLGFIGSVNRALERAMIYNDHVVLLNSDALVPNGWASRLLAPILADGKVASVTPLSNDAEIFTVPHICQRFDIAPDLAEKIDAALRETVSANAYQSAPTGVGFCMALNLRFLKRIPQLDTAFGKGYGEEVDWCQKAKALGGKNVCQPNVFVEHRGGQSFGSVEKQKAIARNNALISHRYPKFDKSVQKFIASDSLRSARIVAAVAVLSQQCSKVPIYIAHSMGGGAELYLQDRIKEKRDTGLGAVVLRVGGPHKWRIEVALPGGWLHADTNDFALIEKVLAPAQDRSLIYSCAVGESDPFSVLKAIHKLLTRKSTLMVLVHDYFMISPSYCLINSTGTYAGIPDVFSDDNAHRFALENGGAISLKDWQQQWANVLNRATEIRCFSKSSATILISAYPEIEASVTVVPHAVFTVSPLNPSRQKLGKTIGVLGDIGAQKGAGVVRKIAQHVPNPHFNKMVVIGRVDPQFRLPLSAIETGAYRRQDIATLAENHAVACWLIPSVWPETFSYTTHEALATGLPVFCFDIGAQGDAVATAQNGHLLPFEWSNDPARIVARITEVLKYGTTGQRLHPNPQGGRNRGFAA